MGLLFFALKHILKCDALCFLNVLRRVFHHLAFGAR